jgi:hypothetical protein
VNLQQYYAEEWLVEACAEAGVELRWKHRIAVIRPRRDGAELRVETPFGEYDLHADWLVACDGARSFIRESMGLPFQGQVFRDRFLIADVVIKGEVEFPTERWFWFDPPFHPGQSVLLHKQPDDVWRIDFQLGWDADPEAEKQPERVIPRVQAMLGEDVPFELEWVSIYTFRCRRLDRFRAWPRGLRRRQRPPGEPLRARAAAMAACRMPTIWPGNWPPSCAGRPRRRCSTARCGAWRRGGNILHSPRSTISSRRRRRRRGYRERCWNWRRGTLRAAAGEFGRLSRPTSMRRR